MSLDFKFFEKRNKIIEKKSKDGLIELEHFMKANNINPSHLLEPGILEPKEMLSTAELYDFRPSKKPKTCLSYDKNHDIIWIRPGMEKAFKDIALLN